MSITKAQLKTLGTEVGVRETTQTELAHPCHKKARFVVRMDHSTGKAYDVSMNGYRALLQEIRAEYKLVDGQLGMFTYVGEEDTFIVFP